MNINVLTIGKGCGPESPVAGASNKPILIKRDSDNGVEQASELPEKGCAAVDDAAKIQPKTAVSELFTFAGAGMDNRHSHPGILR